MTSSRHHAIREIINNPTINDIILTSYHGVEHLEERDTAFQFLDGGRQSHEEVEDERGADHHQEYVIDPNTV